MSAIHVEGSVYDLIHADKYRGPQESFRECCNRQASVLSDSPAHYDAYRHILLGDLFLPGGRIQSSVGSTRITTAFNCLSGDTKILTLEYGAIEIEKVAGQSVHLLDGNGEWILCPILDHGEQETYDLVFKGGFHTTKIRSTLEHGWIAKNGSTVQKTKAFTHENAKREIADLRPTKKVGEDVEYRQGIVHGLVYGDGAYDSRGNGAIQFRLCSHHEDLMPWLSEFPCSYPPSSNGDPIYHISVSRVWGKLKSFPEKASHSYLLGFLRGWFAADGCVSNQPEATICGDEDEMNWLLQWGPVVGWHVRGSTTLSPTTNFGERKKKSLNIRLRTSSMDLDDFLLSHHIQRWKTRAPKRRSLQGRSWRVYGKIQDKKIERVYCPVVPTTHSFALACGIHSSNCFVSGRILDSFVHGHGCIMDRAKEAAATMRLGGGIGYGFSTLRPFGALIKKLESYTTGPVSFMNILDAVCGCVSSAGHRRGAQMAVLLICHPDIERFIHAKQNGTALRNFNLSVAITDAFMKALQSKTPFDLTFEEEVYRTVNPDSLWEMLMRSTWDWADPGVLFIDRINQMNNLWYCETIEATNPCGEQPLPPYGACLLGSFNLVRCLKHTGSKFVFDWDLLKEAIPHVVRAMDNVIDRTLYPLHEQEQEAKEKRRMGLGVTGLANTLEALGFRYGDEGFLDTERAVLSFLRDHTYLASVDLAKEKGSFKKFKKHEYLSGQFIRTLPDNVKDGIEQHGIRNSHLLSIAPTGTISLAAGNVSSGIEPVMEYEYKRDIITPQGKQTFTLSDYGYRELGIRGQRVKELGVDAHVDVLITAQPYVDSAVSKTVNIPKDYDWTAFKDVYLKAYLGGAKGCTTYREGGKRESIFSDINENDSCTIDAEGRKSCE